MGVGSAELQAASTTVNNTKITTNLFTSFILLQMTNYSLQELSIYYILCWLVMRPLSGVAAIGQIAYGSSGPNSRSFSVTMMICGWHRASWPWSEAKQGHQPSPNHVESILMDLPGVINAGADLQTGTTMLPLLLKAYN
jgi:hypothetical protein